MMISAEKEMLLMLRNKIPVSVIIVTKNEEGRIALCLEHLSDFDEVVVVDSSSDDKTVYVAQKMGASVENFVWNGQYPKKRQWCLDNLDLKHDWVFFVDADEIVTPSVVYSIAALFKDSEQDQAGFFVSSQYCWQMQQLRFGLQNNKLVLFDRRRVEFPVVDDLDIKGMGEIEGHYQPILKKKFAADSIGRLKGKMLHKIDDDVEVWEARHFRYAQWETGMNARDIWPVDPVPWREFLKQAFRKMPMRNVAAFLHCYVLKLGFLDGAHGFDFALSRARYYTMISDFSKTSRGLV